MQHFFERHSNNTAHRIIQLSRIPGNTLNLWKRCCRITPKNALRHLDTGNMKGGVITKPNETNNDGFVQRWNRMKKSQTIEMYGRIHSDICNVPLYLLSGVKIQIKFTKAKQAFFVISNKADSKVKFVFKEAKLYVKRIRPNASTLFSHNEALLKGYPARYNLTRVEPKTFTFASGSRSLSVDNAVLGVLPKYLIFTMVKKHRLFG